NTSTGAHNMQLVSTGSGNNPAQFNIYDATSGKNIFGSNGNTGGIALGSYATGPLIAGVPTNGLIVSGNVGIGTTAPQARLDIATTGTAASALIVPRDTTANRPTSGVNGMIR